MKNEITTPAQPAEQISWDAQMKKLDDLAHANESLLRRVLKVTRRIDKRLARQEGDST